MFREKGVCIDVTLGAKRVPAGLPEKVTGPLRNASGCTPVGLERGICFGKGRYPLFPLGCITCVRD
jgi:hypothetical protein